MSTIDRNAHQTTKHQTTKHQTTKNTGQAKMNKRAVAFTFLTLLIVFFLFRYIQSEQSKQVANENEISRYIETLKLNHFYQDATHAFTQILGVEDGDILRNGSHIRVRLRGNMTTMNFTSRLNSFTNMYTQIYNITQGKQVQFRNIDTILYLDPYDASILTARERVYVIRTSNEPKLRQLNVTLRLSKNMTSLTDNLIDAGSTNPSITLLFVDPKGNTTSVTKQLNQTNTNGQFNIYCEASGNMTIEFGPTTYGQSTLVMRANNMDFNATAIAFLYEDSSQPLVSLRSQLLSYIYSPTFSTNRYFTLLLG